MVSPNNGEITDDMGGDIINIPTSQKDILVDPQTSSLAQQFDALSPGPDFIVDPFQNN